ncbi:MAG: hypothetical protein MJA29_04780, partial [Candidatus Omnitrophica bacterium]|nr:hypothetical protein [Candidatus Omnitrophota bacterium]
MRQLIVVTAILLASGVVGVSAQDTVDMSTFYPSPFGSYNDLEIEDRLSIIDQASAENATVYADAGGNLTINGTQPWYTMRFDDSGVQRDFSFMTAYAGSNPACPAGFVPVAVLESDKTPAIPGAVPAAGYVMCVRG